MAKKIWGGIRKVLLDLASDFVEVNEDLEAVTIAKAKAALGKGGDLYPRGYHVPEVELNIRCLATRKDGKVKLLGFGGAESQENTIEVQIRAPFATRPLNQDEIARIADMEEARISKELEDRGIQGVGGDYFIPDDDG